jgi:predicted NBD/HSP70 family sugar kinase
MADQLGLPTTLDNDANCAVFGEWWRGAARGSKHAIGFTIGTGIGGGIIVDGRLYHGATDCAGEFGHMTLDPEGRRCKCGNYGCLEAYASGPAIALRAVEALDSGAESQIVSMVSGNLARVTAQTVYDAAHEGDALALEVVRDTARYLGAGVANLVNIFNPEVVVICGGVTLAGERLMAPLRQEVTRRAFKPAVQRCRIVRASSPAPRACMAPPRASCSWCPTDALPDPETRRLRRVGVLGSLVWDEIHGRDSKAAPVEEWGGIAYAMAGMDAALPQGWEIVPLIKVGRDLAAESQAFLRTLGFPAERGASVRPPTIASSSTTRMRSGAASGCRAVSRGGRGPNWDRWSPIWMPSMSISFRASNWDWAPRRRCARLSGARSTPTCTVSSWECGTMASGYCSRSLTRRTGSAASMSSR